LLVKDKQYPHRAPPKLHRQGRQTNRIQSESGLVCKRLR
jgi:hypothetical protein